MSTQDLGQYNSAVRQNGVRLSANEPLVAAGANTLSGATTISGALSVTGTAAFTTAPTGPVVKSTTQSALVGATVVLTAADSGKVFQNRSTSGSPSWTLPAAANGLVYTFTTANTTTGFTVTAAGTIHAKTNAAGTAVSGTTLTNTQASAVVGDAITLVSDGTAWWVTAQTGVFTAAQSNKQNNQPPKWGLFIFKQMQYTLLMELKSLEDKKLAIENSFNELTKQISELESERVRLQGEYRLVDELITNYKVKETKK